MGPTDSPPALEEIRQLVEHRLSNFLATEIDRWGELDPELIAPLDALRQMVLAGGKRLRPAFCYWAFVGSGGDPATRMDGQPSIVDAGASLEMLHTFALIHDDIMDGSVRRRGRETIHVSFENLHQSREWRGEGRRFGEAVAILAGDLAFVYADSLLSGMSVDTHRVFSDLRLEVNVGQYLDLLGTATDGISVEAAKRIRVFKSGKYTVERPLHFGAALAGRFGEMAAPLSAYGLPLGEAFQLRDDLLGAFGDASLMGKDVGEDLREGKPTLLYALTRERANPSQTKVLDSFFGKPDLSPDEAGQLQAIIMKSGAKAAVEESIERLVEEAITAIALSPLTGTAQKRLIELAHYVAGRRS